tara:strand:+ start:301 stop:504 length:204 start_codon:yes stop_codon:yes gene_type:complete
VAAEVQVVPQVELEAMVAVQVLREPALGVLEQHQLLLIGQFMQAITAVLLLVLLIIILVVAVLVQVQ